jgi:predicted signal transduction protein with EAL and GGDEF domain
MRIPVWLTLGVAILVILFGAHRIRLSLRSEEDEGRARQRKGLYAMSRRTHRLIGVVYLLLGAALVAASFGWNPFGDL